MDLQALVGQSRTADDTSFQTESPAEAIAFLADASAREKPGLPSVAAEPNVTMSAGMTSANAMSESSARQSAILGQQPPTASAPRMRLAPRDPAALPPDDSSRRVDTPKPLLRTLAWILRLCAIVLVLMAAIIVFTHLDGGESELVAALVGVAGLIAAATVWTIGEIAAFLALQR